MKKYEKPEFEVIEFTVEDVITVSTPVVNPDPDPGDGGTTVLPFNITD